MQYSSALYPELHSFPTRRSSDLTIRRDEPVDHDDLHDTSASVPNYLFRSEEHTSELQSPCNLVCLLLLEKKKINALRDCLVVVVVVPGVGHNFHVAYIVKLFDLR